MRNREHPARFRSRCERRRDSPVSSRRHILRAGPGLHGRTAPVIPTHEQSCAADADGSRFLIGKPLPAAMGSERSHRARE